MKKVNNLNENEIKAINAILETCDDIDGEYFTRIDDAIMALVKVFGNGNIAGGYFTALENKGVFETDEDSCGPCLWVNVD